MDAVVWNRFLFGFTAAYHYLFPQLTMGLAFLIFVMKVIGLRTKDERYDNAARFWGRIFGINFAVGVVTGIPMEFQFGTNWARFSNSTGGVIGLTLAMEGLFAFFAESAFLGLFLFGEKRLSKSGHLFAAFMVFIGSWLSGYFIIATNAFMQHPVGYSVGPRGALQLADFWGYVLNPWAIAMYAHNMSGAVITGSFVVAAVAAFWTLMGHHKEAAQVSLKVGVYMGLIFSLLQIFPTGDHQGKMVARFQPASLAAMEGKFETSQRAELVFIGQPDVKNRKLENPLYAPGLLSMLAYGSFGAEVKGLNDFPQDRWPDNVELLYYAYHIMVGLGTMFIALMGLSSLFQWKNKLATTKPLLWILMLAFPFPYIANTMGWMTTELGRQPWTVYGILRTIDGTSPKVSAGNVSFSTLGFMGLYLVMGLLFAYLVMREIERGPQATGGHDASGPPTDGDPTRKPETPAMAGK